VSQRLLTVAWVLIGISLFLLVVVAWQRVHPHRSSDQKILIERAK